MRFMDDGRNIMIPSPVGDFIAAFVEVSPRETLMLMLITRTKTLNHAVRRLENVLVMGLNPPPRAQTRTCTRGRGICCTP